MYFVSRNNNKYREVLDLIRTLGDKHIELKFKNVELEEIQSKYLEKVSEHKAIQAFNKVEEDTLIEDDGLFIESLNGFPGVYSSYAFETVGNKGIVKLLENQKNRQAQFRSAFGYYDGQNLKVFTGEIQGSISFEPIGEGWGYDPIFIPNDLNKTFAQIGHNVKNKISHRKIALEKFYHWYVKIKIP